MSKVLVSIPEWTSRSLPCQLTEWDRQRLQALSPFVMIDELRTGIRVTAKSYVGVIRFDNLDIEIVPKLVGGKSGLVGLIDFTFGINVLKRSLRSSQLTIDESTTLFDLIAQLLCGLVERLVQAGLLHGYVEVTDDITVLRGRLLIEDQVRRHFGRVDTLACRFDEHIKDNLENQVIFDALKLCRSLARHQATRARVNRLVNLFSSVCSSLPVSWRYAKELIIYNRQNEYYRDAHALAWLVLESAGVNEFGIKGDIASFAFFVDMNGLFEKFVERLISRILENDPYYAGAQVRSRTAIWDRTRGRPYSDTIPDVLIYDSSRNPVVTVDAKYKRYEGRRVEPPDIYQGMLYALTHGPSGRVGKAMIVHPADGEFMTRFELEARNRSSVSQAHLDVVSVPVPNVLEELAHRQPKVTISALRAIILDAIGGSD